MARDSYPGESSKYDWLESGKVNAMHMKRNSHVVQQISSYQDPKHSNISLLNMT